MEHISQKVVAYFLRNNVITEDEQDIYQYGIKLIISNVLGVVLILLAGVILNQFWFAVVHLVCMITVRIYSGGFHADTYIVCNSSSVITFLLVCGVTVWLPPKIWLWSAIIFCIVALIIAFYLSPVEHPNKPFTKKQGRKYRMISLTMMVLLSISAIILTIYRIQIGVCIAATLLAISILMIAGIMKNHFLRSDG
ncbi:MAG: hypothetical protein DBX37_02580 [Massilioclostridium sp.]|nr:MAG: hypothetical protein DBX37_02580 [Massilioclostridium sp.]